MTMKHRGCHLSNLGKYSSMRLLCNTYFVIELIFLSFKYTHTNNVASRIPNTSHKVGHNTVNTIPRFYLDSYVIVAHAYGSNVH